MCDVIVVNKESEKSGFKWRGWLVNSKLKVTFLRLLGGNGVWSADSPTF
jgi:hypothetical protein